MRLLLALLLLLPIAARAADLKVASPRELKLATWNLEWLTLRPAGDPALPADATLKSAADIAMLHRYADLLAADVVAFEEVDGPEAAAQVFEPDRYVIQATADHVVQRTGFAIRRGLAFTANPDVTSIDPYPEAPHPLRSGADITLDLPGAKFRLLAVHLKTGCREDDFSNTPRPVCHVLAEQLVPLRAWIAARQAEGVAFAVLGDFNRWMEPPDAFWAGLAQAAPLLRATSGRYSQCWGGGRFIDHIIAGGPARAWMQPESLRELVYRERGLAWREHLSDHCPLSVRFAVPE